jgi:hypothetical protein
MVANTLQLFDVSVGFWFSPRIVPDGWAVSFECERQFVGAVWVGFF